MGVRKYSGRGKMFGAKRGILWMNISNCCSEPGSNQSCKEVKKEKSKGRAQKTVNALNPIAEEKKEEA